MNLKIHGIALTALALAACSSQPTQPSAKAATPSPAASAPAQSAAAAVPVAATADGQPPPINRTLIAAGYKANNINGQLYYCRQEDVTGTNFKKKVCLNEDQMKDKEREIKELQDRMMRGQPNPSCIGPTCSGG